MAGIFDYMNAPLGAPQLTRADAIAATMRDIGAAMSGRPGQNLMLLRQQAALEQERQRENEILRRKENALNALKAKYPEHAAEIDAGYFDKVLAATGPGAIEDKYSDIKSDAYGQMYGLNKFTQSYEPIPGSRIPKGYVLPGTDAAGNQVSEFFVPRMPGVPPQYSAAPGAGYMPGDAELAQMMAEDVADNEGVPYQPGMEVVETPAGTLARIGARGKPEKPTAGEAKQFASTDVALENATRMAQLIDENPDSSIFGLTGLAHSVATEANPLGWAADQAMELLGEGRTEVDTELLSLSQSLGNQVLAAMRGAAVGPKEQAMFQRQLPTPGQPRDVFARNLALTIRNLQQMNAKMKEERGFDSGEQPSTVTAGTQEDPLNVRTEEEWNALPSGAWVRFPDGSVVRKK